MHWAEYLPYNDAGRASLDYQTIQEEVQTFMYCFCEKEGDLWHQID